MSLVFKLETGEPALQAAPLAGEPAPASDLPPPEPALLDWATLTPPVDSHLAPCPHCGSPNGVSASSCWSCEASLLPLRQSRRGRAPWLAATTPTHAPDPADESLPVLTSAVEDNSPTAQHGMTSFPTSAPASAPVPGAVGRGHAWQTGASILIVAAVAVGALVYFETPAPAPPRVVKGGGFIVDTPETAALMNHRPAPTAPADLVGAGNAPPGVAEARPDALRALAVEPGNPPAARAQPSAAPAASKAAYAGKARRTPRQADEPTPPAVPMRDRPEPSWQAPPPVRAACTPTVAALGLCTAPSTPTQTKE